VENGIDDRLNAQSSGSWDVDKHPLLDPSFAFVGVHYTNSPTNRAFAQSSLDTNLLDKVVLLVPRT
jgi:hypothetical protein